MSISNIFFGTVWLLVGLLVGATMFVVIADRALINSGGNFPDRIDYGIVK